jgi:hypothetical protein
VNLENKIQEKKMPSEKDKAFSREPSLEVWTTHEKELSKSRYGCEIIKERCTLQDAKDSSLPLDAYLVTYLIDGYICYDITRSAKRVSIFDMYYDKFGPGNITDIRWADGKVNPKLWGYQSPQKKKRK